MRVLSAILAACLLMASCKKSGDIPAYVYVPEIQLITNYATEGTASENITDVWVYVNDDVQGVYQLPAHFPILEEGPVTFSFYGGIKINGITNTRAAYPAYNDTTLTLTLVPGETDTVVPVVRYFPATQFLLKEDFENGNEFVNTERQLNTADVFEGNACTKVVVDTTRKVRVSSSGFFTIPSFSRTVFVEMDYKNSHIMNAGMIVKGAQGTLQVTKVSITPKDDWNKIYLNFTPEIARTAATEMQLFFDIDASSDSEDVQIFIDNVKIVYF